MQIVQEIGSYAGLAAVLGLAVLSALYFSQARDVKRLREWAGRAPERAPESTSVQRVPAQQPAGARPVPRAPGQAGASATAAGAAKPQYPPAPAGARAAATGTGPATSLGPAAATPAAARAAESGGDTEAPEAPANGAAGDGGSDRPPLSQDTVIHPPPSPLDEEEEEEGDIDRPESPLDEDSAEFEAADEDWDEDDDDWDDTGDHPAAPEEHWEDTGDEPAVSALPPVAPRPTVPSPPATAAGAASGASPRPAGTGTPPPKPILPPYSRSRPGAPSPGRGSGGGLFASRGRAAAVITAAVLILAVVAFGAIQLLAGSNDTAKPDKASSSRSASSPSAKKTKKGGAINPASVRVAVLNGTTVPGLAAQIGDSVEKQGFKLGTVTNFNDQQRAESVVLYAPGAEREAAEVGRRLKISQREPIDAASQGVAGDATVVIVTGQDKTQ